MRRLTAVAGRPSVWVALSVLLLAFTPPEDPSSSGATPSDLAIIIAGLLAGRVVLRRPAMARSVPAVGFYAIGAATLVAAALARDFPQNFVGGLRFVELFVLTPLAVMISMRTRADVLVVLGSLLGLGLVEGTLGLVQFATGTGAGIGEESIRAVGTFGAYNIGTLAHLTALGVVICLAIVVVRTGRVRWIAAAACAVLLLANLASLSRGAYIALVVAVVVTVSRGRPARLLATVVAALLTAAIVLPPLVASGTPIGERVASLLQSESEPDQSLIDRQALWRAATQMALDHPLTGVGPRAFPEHRDAYADFSLLGSSDISFDGSFEQVELKSPHSMYLLIASEQGLVALFVWVSVLVVDLVRILIRAARRRDDLATTVAVMGAGLLAYELVVMITGDFGGPGSILTGIAWGIAGWAAADLDLVSVHRGARTAPAEPAPSEPLAVTAGSPA